MRIWQRVYLGFGLLVLLTWVASAYALYVVNQSNRFVGQEKQTAEVLRAVRDLRDGINAAVHNAKDAAMSGDPLQADQAQSQWRDASDKLAEVRALDAAHADRARLLTDIDNGLTSLGPLLTPKAAPTPVANPSPNSPSTAPQSPSSPAGAAAGQSASAPAESGLTQWVAALSTAQSSLDHSLDRFVTAVSDERSATSGRLADINATANTAVLIGMLGFSIIAVVFAWWINRPLNKRLSELLMAIEQVATGDLRVNVAADGEDEVAEVSRAFQMLVDKNATLVQELADAVGRLASSVSELVATAQQQTANVTNQAVALQEASATLDEIKSIARRSNEIARSVMQSSDRSIEASREGQRALEKVSQVMGKIKDQVESIAKNILDLSEKTVQISEITASVNDIAEQSNLLAVNAAIEAAKAGEAGQGFGVVATEVKSLAEQSKNATSQVRLILNDIQRATNYSVMVTEEGTKRVESGVGQVHHAGDNIIQLYDIINESSNAASQIATATTDQVVGIEQILDTIRTMSKMATENVAGARQQSATAQSLSELANDINNLVARYRLS